MRNGEETWTEQRVEQLRQLVTEGFTAAHIARVLGDGISRKAVIGKVHRTGLRLAKGLGRPYKNPSRPKRAYTKSIRRPSMTREEAQDAVRAIEDALPAPEDPFGAEGCRWPLGEIRENTFRFCQRERAERSSMCVEHHTLAYIPSPRRKTI